MTLVLPSCAYRRSWFLEQFAEHADGWYFAQVLREVAPQVYAALPDRSGLACYKALWAHVNTLFPLVEIEYAEVAMWAEENGERELTELREYGMPIDSRGCADHELYYPGYDSEHTDWGAAVCTQMLAAAQGDVAAPVPKLLARLPRSLRSLQLERYLDAGMAKRPIQVDKPPRGRTWRPPWDGLGDYVRWVSGQTGSMILDYSHDDVMEMGGYPAWDAAEIRGFARDWARFAPMWKRIEAVRDYLSRGGAERLLELAGLLAGQEKARQACSTAKPQPLWKQFSRMHR